MIVLPPGTLEVRLSCALPEYRMNPPFHITCQQPYLVTTFHEPQTLLSWAMIRPGFQVGRKVAWLEVRDADLPQDFHPFALLEAGWRRQGMETQSP